MSDLQRLAYLQHQKDELVTLISETSEDGDIVAELNFSTRLESVANEIEALLATEALSPLASIYDHQFKRHVCIPT